MLAEAPCEMALIGKTGPERDLRERFVGLRELPRGPIQSQPSDVEADGCAKPNAEHTRQVHWVNTHFLRQLDGRERFEEALV